MDHNLGPSIPRCFDEGPDHAFTPRLFAVHRYGIGHRGYTCWFADHRAGELEARAWRRRRYCGWSNAASKVNGRSASVYGIAQPDGTFGIRTRIGKSITVCGKPELAGA